MGGELRGGGYKERWRQESLCPRVLMMGKILPVPVSQGPSVLKHRAREGEREKDSREGI